MNLIQSYFIRPSKLCRLNILTVSLNKAKKGSFMSLSSVNTSHLLIILFQQMHYTVLLFTCPYMCFGTPCAILRGFVEISQCLMHPIHFHNINSLSLNITYLLVHGGQLVFFGVLLKLNN
jgi:hypothetical protein